MFLSLADYFEMKGRSVLRIIISLYIIYYINYICVFLYICIIFLYLTEIFGYLVEHKAEDRLGEWFRTFVTLVL